MCSSYWVLFSGVPVEGYANWETTGPDDFDARTPSAPMQGLPGTALHARDHLELDLLGANRFALANIGAASEKLETGLRHHAVHPFVTLGLALRQQAQMRDLRTREQRRRRIRTSRHTGAAPDARRRVHGQIGTLL